MTLMHYLFVGFVLIISNIITYLYAVRQGMIMASKELDDLNKERQSNRAKIRKERHNRWSTNGERDND